MEHWSEHNTQNINNMPLIQCEMCGLTRHVGNECKVIKYISWALAMHNT
jgi:hypothetical protein